ncbi:MAG: hypothetical protein OXF02_08090 [Simkaniaceae bacterium]|nr:hypothetical protein [Simkaniaceae bacterium]
MPGHSEFRPIRPDDDMLATPHPSTDHERVSSSEDISEEIAPGKDPFSECNLFLFRRIGREIKRSGRVSGWSCAIEERLASDLLAKLKKRFPKYRFDFGMLKEVWKRVDSHYTSLEKDKGKIEPSVLVRRELEKGGDTGADPDVIFRIGECIAVVRGEKPDLEHVARIVRAARTSMASPSSVAERRGNTEPFDRLDQLIVKMVIEVCGDYPGSDFISLKTKTIKRLKAFGHINRLARENRILPLLSAIWVGMGVDIDASLFPLREERRAFERFIDIHLRYLKESPDSSSPYEYRATDRLLTLYPLVKALPGGISRKEMREMVYRVLYEDKVPSPESPFVLFVRSEIDCISSGHEEETMHVLAERIYSVYKMAERLPDATDRIFDNFIRFTRGRVFDAKTGSEALPRESIAMLRRELGATLFAFPDQSPTRATDRVARFVRKAIPLPLYEEKRGFWEIAQKKVEIWALHGEMLCDRLHFDPEEPLFFAFRKLHTCHTSVTRMESKIVRMFPSFAPFRKELRSRLRILDRYVRYGEGAKGGESTYVRFLRSRADVLAKEFPDPAKSEFLEKLREGALTTFPHIPFDRVCRESNVSFGS